MVQKRYVILIVLLIILVGALFLGWHARRAFGEITIEKYDIVRSNGRTVSFRVYRPTTNTYGQPRPSVITIHGISGSGPMMDPYNIELARRNFTVISMDLTGHGRSPETFGFDALLEAASDAYAAVSYIQANDPDTHDTIYGVLGHSLGAGVSLLFQNISTLPQSTVLIGGGMGNQFGGFLPPINQTNPRNLMLASGVYDELVSPQIAIETLSQATGQPAPAPQITYGNFTEGTARKLVFSLTNHLFETSDSKIVAESVDWLIRSLQGVAQREQATLDPVLQIHRSASLADLVAILSLVFGLFPVLLISYSLIPLRLRPQRASEVTSSLGKKGGIRYSIVIGILMAILFLVMLLMGLGFEFGGLVIVPVSFGTGLTLLSFLSALVIFRVSRKYLDKNTITMLTPDFRDKTNRDRLAELGKATLVILPAMAWLFAWSFIGRLGFEATLPFTFAVDSGVAPVRLTYFLMIVILMLPLFYADTLWLNAAVGTLYPWQNHRELVRRSIRALFSRLVGLGILIAALYMPFLLGVQLGFIMFVALLMLPFAVLFGLSTLMTVWINGITRSNITAALLNSVLMAVVIASTFQLL